MKLSGNKVINKIDGIIKARENNGKVHDIFFNNIEIEPDSDGTGSEEFGIERELNPFIESDKKYPLYCFHNFTPFFLFLSIIAFHQLSDVFSSNVLPSL